MAARCVQGQLAACVLAKQRFRTAVADAAQSAQVKISCKIEHDAARLLAQGDALWATRRAAEAASSGAVEQRIDVALVAGSTGIAGGIAVVQACCCWLAYSKGMRLPSICLIGCINKCGWQRAAEMKHDSPFLPGNATAPTTLPSRCR